MNDAQALIAVSLGIGLAVVVAFRYRGSIKARLRGWGFEIGIEAADRDPGGRSDAERSPEAMSIASGDLSGTVTLVRGDGNTIVSGTEDRLDHPILDVVGVDIIDGEDEDRFPRLDVIVRNRGHVAEVIREFAVDHVEMFAFPAPENPSALEVTWTYDLDLSRESHTIRLDPPQVVDGSAATRFQVALGTTEPQYPYRGHWLFLFEARMGFGAPTRTVELGTFLASVPQPMQVAGLYRRGLAAHERHSLREELARLESKLSREVFIHSAASDAIAEIRDALVEDVWRGPDPVG